VSALAGGDAPMIDGCMCACHAVAQENALKTRGKSKIHEQTGERKPIGKHTRSGTSLPLGA
jgi:hypothetical protein